MFLTVPLLLLALAGAAPEPPIEVTVQRLAEDRWQAVYRLAEPAPAVRFVRTPPFRGEEWNVETPGLTLTRVGEADLVIGEQPFDRLTISFPTNTTPLVKDYELVDRFTDGSVILYSGHLDLHPVAADADGAWERAARIAPTERPVMAYRFLPLADEGVYVPGGGDRWESATSGVYVYFGDLRPLESEHVVAFVDPGLPDDLRRAFDRSLPRLFELYEERFAAKLAIRPTVYLNAVPSARGYSTRGGVTGAVVQLAVEADFAAPPPDLGERLVHLIAHEAAHLWNGNRFHHRQRGGSSWLHEGSADALAERALAEIGEYDTADLARLASRQATQCARGLVDTRLIDSTAGGRFQLMYACGAVVALLTERGWREGDLFDFWARLFAGSREDGEYTVADYLALTWQLAGPGVADSVYRLIHEELADPFDFLRAALGEVGVEAAVAVGAASDDQRGSMPALVWLVGQDCGGSYSIYTEADALKIEGSSRCGVFEADRFYPVTQVAGHSVHAGRAVDAAIADLCGEDVPVPLTLRDGTTLDVPCPETWRADRRTLSLSW